MKYGYKIAEINTVPVADTRGGGGGGAEPPYNFDRL